MEHHIRTAALTVDYSDDTETMVTGSQQLFSDDLLRGVPTAAYIALPPEGIIAASNDLAHVLLGRVPRSGEHDRDFFRAGLRGEGLNFQSPSLRVLHEHVPQVSGSAYVTRSDGTEVFVAYHAVVVPGSPGVLVTLQAFSGVRQFLPADHSALEGLQQMYRLAETISSTEQTSEILECAVSVMLNATGAQAAIIAVAAPHGGTLPLCSGGLSDQEIAAFGEFNPWKNGEDPIPAVIPIDASMPAALRELAEARSFKAITAVPLTARSHWHGYCLAFFEDSDAASGIAFQTFVTISGMITIALDRKRVEAEMLHREQEAIRKMESRVIDRTRELSQINRILMTEITERKRTEGQLKEEIGERRKAEESLRVLSQHLVDAQESERRRLAQELHDGVNQILSATKLRILSAYERLTAPDRTKQHEERLRSDIEKARMLLDESIKEIRNISKNLRPSVLDHLGLVPALRVLCDELRDAGYEIVLRCERLPAKFSANIDVTLYRIIQECLNNIVKHSEATAIELILRYRQSVLEASIKDNGKGFQVKEEPVDDRTGYGLVSMKERGLYVGGTVTVRSKPGKGTTVVVRIPFIESSQEEGTQA